MKGLFLIRLCFSFGPERHRGFHSQHTRHGIAAPIIYRGVVRRAERFPGSFCRCRSDQLARQGWTGWDSCRRMTWWNGCASFDSIAFVVLRPTGRSFGNSRRGSSDFRSDLLPALPDGARHAVDFYMAIAGARKMGAALPVPIPFSSRALAAARTFAAIHPFASSAGQRVRRWVGSNRWLEKPVAHHAGSVVCGDRRKKLPGAVTHGRSL